MPSKILCQDFMFHCIKDVKYIPMTFAICGVIKNKNVKYMDKTRKSVRNAKSTQKTVSLDECHILSLL